MHAGLVSKRRTPRQPARPGTHGFSPSAIPSSRQSSAISVPISTEDVFPRATTRSLADEDDMKIARNPGIETRTGNRGRQLSYHPRDGSRESILCKTPPPCHSPRLTRVKAAGMLEIPRVNLKYDVQQPRAASYQSRSCLTRGLR